MIKIQNCNNIDLGEISISKNHLNIKYAFNGTGKSTISNSIIAKIQGNEDELKKLLPFKYKNDETMTPCVDGIDDYTSSNKRNGKWRRNLLLVILLCISIFTSYMGIFNSIVNPVENMEDTYYSYKTATDNLIDYKIGQVLTKYKNSDIVERFLTVFNIMYFLNTMIYIIVFASILNKGIDFIDSLYEFTASVAKVDNTLVVSLSLIFWLALITAILTLNDWKNNSTDNEEANKQPRLYNFFCNRVKKRGRKN